MKKNQTIFRLLTVFWTLFVFAGMMSCSAPENKAENSGDTKNVVLENDTLKVEVDGATGCFSVLEKISGQEWGADPWEKAAGLLEIKAHDGKVHTVNLSHSESIEINQPDANTVALTFLNPKFPNGEVAMDVSVSTRLHLDPKNAQLDVEITDVKKVKHTLVSLRYPAREFSLFTDVDHGAAVVPQKQGVICPSYIFQMNAAAFCQWDDATYDKRSVGELQVYGNGTGLSMPWWGTYNEKSAVVGILSEETANSEAAKMHFNINNNGQYLFNADGKLSPNPRVTFLDPVWQLAKEKAPKKITYHFIPGGNYVQMAKTYRKEAIKKGYFLSLRDKAKVNPNVSKLAGAVYLGVYGGYPHYVHMPGMAFTFDELKNMVKTTHDELKVDNAFIHAWGVFSNYPPNCWPISEKLGGPKKLREVVDLTKKYGWLYSSYHAYTPLLENDPDFSTDLMGRDKDGKLIRAGSRWARVAAVHYKDLAAKNFDKEIETLGQIADITDIAFVFTPDSGNVELAKYLRPKKLVMGTEHGQEHWVPYFDMFEGMTYYENTVFGIPLSTVSHKAPLWNLVYHDAITNFGKIQDPDNEISLNGDFRTKSLRNMLNGAGSLIFFAPYEFEGSKDMIRMANKVVSPVHRETFFEELVSHEFLSTDFMVQRTRFSNGTEVVANLNAAPQKIDDGSVIPGFGFRVKHTNGKITKGQFKLSVSLN